MLDPDDRSILLDQLRAPLGYRLDAAVATTFTLDLTAALVPPLAFAAAEVRGTPDPITALEAIRSCADRVDLFCQAGQIRVPKGAPALVAFLEPMIHEVRRPRPGHLFHPKVWFLRYTSDEGDEDQYRLICSSRNLTQDAAWDAAVRLDGTRVGRPSAANRPLADLLRFLPSQAVHALPRERRQRIQALAEDARHIAWEHPSLVKEVAFHAFGVDGTRIAADFSGYRHLVMSPFCSDDGLAEIVGDSPDVTLISRREEIERLAPETLECVSRLILDPLAITQENDDHDEAGPHLGGLHAKVIVAERNRAAHVFIGSLNATRAALHGNVEFVVELVGGATKIGVDRFVGDHAALRSVLLAYDAPGGAPVDAAEEIRRAVDDALRDLAAVPHTILVTPHASPDSDRMLPADQYAIAVAGQAPAEVPPGMTASVALLTAPGRAGTVADGEATRWTLSPVTLIDITPFLVFTVAAPSGHRGSTVVRGLLVGDPAERRDEILARQVDTPEKFLRFLTLLLGLGELPVGAREAGSDGLGSRSRFGPAPGVLELALRALAQQPQALDDLDRLVERLLATAAGRQLLPTGFTDLWPVIMAARESLPGARRG